MKSNWSLVGALTLLASAFLPGLAAAESNAVLYEVTENLKLKSLQSGRRMATAILSGTVEAGNSVCPATVGVYCVLTATAADNLDISTGKGPVTGKFRVHVQDTNPVDGAELVILEGTLTGRMSLAPALFGPDGIPGTGDELPLGTLNGLWSARGARGGPLQGVRAGGTLTGTFRLPFVGFPQVCQMFGNPPDCPLYLHPTDTGLVPVPLAWNEFSLGVPTVKLEITFEDKD